MPLVIKIKRGGTGGTGGSGPTGYKATQRALLSRHLADRPGAAAATTARQAAATEAKKRPRKIIWPDRAAPGWMVKPPKHRRPRATGNYPIKRGKISVQLKKGGKFIQVVP
jgi:hypothetical protein